ncbi:MAG: hypothetical protein WD342_16660 [Verrucomicrobiales bacterium]
MKEESSRDHGSQPLDRLLDELRLTNHALVGASSEQLTHKQVQKARKGREVTANIQRKIVAALEAAAGGDKGRFKREDLFNYGP